MRRVPGSPMELSVSFYNIHGRPRRLPRPPSHRLTMKNVGNKPSTKVFENSNKKFECFTGDLKRVSIPEPPLRIVISEIITDILKNVVKDGNSEIKPQIDSVQLLNDSDCSLDDPLITNSFGDPVSEALN